MLEEIAVLGGDWEKERMIKLAVTFAMDRKASQRELTSRLISDMYGEQVLDQNAIAKGETKVVGVVVVVMLVKWWF